MTFSRVPTRFFLPVLLTLFIAGPAFGQETERDLRQENEDLRQQVRDLQEELDAAQARITRLERTIEQLRAGQDSGSAGEEAPEEPEVTIDESKPEASPRAHLRAVIESHDEAMADMEIGREGSRQRVGYMRALEGWVAAANRNFRMPIEWRVHLDEMNVLRRGNAQATLIAVDPVTGAELGDPFDVMLESLIVRRIIPVQERGDLDTLVLHGVVTPQIRINQDRRTQGPFNNPPFIGPFVEYQKQIEVRSLVPAEEPEQPGPDAQSGERRRPQNTAPTPSSRPGR